jgi:hypothetical protein
MLTYVSMKILSQVIMALCMKRYLSFNKQLTLGKTTNLVFILCNLDGRERIVVDPEYN